MLQFLAHDTVNDVALIKTSFQLHVRYGLDVKTFALGEIDAAMVQFHHAQRHALDCEAV